MLLGVLNVFGLSLVKSLYALGVVERVQFRFGEVFVVMGRILVSECGTAREDHTYEIPVSHSLVTTRPTHTQ